jgi:hypothetical protein
MARAWASMRACSVCSRASLTGCGVSVVQCRGWRPGPRREDEGERAVEADVLDQLHRARVVLVGLAGEADDEVARQADAGPHARSLRTVDLNSSAV